MSRRSALRSAGVIGGLGVAAIASRRAGILDDMLRGIGLKPHPQPDPADDRRLADAAAGQATLVAAIRATSSAHNSEDLDDLRRIAEEQLRAVSSTPPSAPAPSIPADESEALASLADLASSTADARARDALATGSADVLKVLGSMAAGLDQISQVIRRRL